MEKITKHLPITTIFIAYLFICGSLYIVGFWTTFDIDITNFLSITEIPKSFIIPFLLANGLTLFQIVCNSIASPPELKNDIKKEESNKEMSNFKKKFFDYLYFLTKLEILILIMVLIVIFCYYRYKTETLFWSLSSITFALLMSLKALRNIKLIELIPKNNFRMYLTHIFVMIPIFSFSTGKINGLNIYNNTKITYIELDNDDEKNLHHKLIGFIGEKLIVSDLKNENILVINQSSLNNIQLKIKK